MYSLTWRTVILVVCLLFSKRDFHFLSLTSTVAVHTTKSVHLDLEAREEGRGETHGVRDGEDEGGGQTLAGGHWGRHWGRSRPDCLDTFCSDPRQSYDRSCVSLCWLSNVNDYLMLRKKKDVHFAKGREHKQHKEPPSSQPAEQEEEAEEIRGEIPGRGRQTGQPDPQN